ncbi:MAG: VOC family protein [Myxococcales bacterium]|nr:VOC family protein [Myxococcales bacterium]MCB9649223.1 VOC family protein [Deltaproteobacteria bacterium]
MAKVSTYLNFNGDTEAAFNFYKAVFGTDFAGPINRMGDIPPAPGMPQLSEAEQKLVMHVALPILGGHMLMGTDILESMGHTMTVGTNVNINLEPDSREEADRLFAALSAGGEVQMPMADMFWGAYYGSFTDKFGIRWMVNFAQPR